MLHAMKRDGKRKSSRSECGSYEFISENFLNARLAASITTFDYLIYRVAATRVGSPMTYNLHQYIGRSCQAMLAVDTDAMPACSAGSRFFNALFPEGQKLHVETNGSSLPSHLSHKS
jgi:hypothetical protein